MAHLDARPTGDQKVASSTPAEVGNILSGRLIVKYFIPLIAMAGICELSSLSAIFHSVSMFCFFFLFSLLYFIYLFIFV